MSDRLGFGCAHLMRLGAARERDRLLAAAFDAGIRHFDVARIYGLGAAEAELGRFIRGRRDEVVIATKFGLALPPGGGLIRRIQRPVRALAGRVPAAKAALLRGASAAQPGFRFAPDEARASVEASLRALGVNEIDMLLMHEPMPEAVDPAEVAACLDGFVQDGLVGAWGVSGDPEPTGGVVARFAPRVPVTQVRWDAVRDPAVSEPNAVFGVLSRALPAVVAHAGGSLETQARWHEATGADCADPEAVAALLIEDACVRWPGVTVLMSTTRPERLPAAVAAATRAAHARPELARFRALVDAEVDG